MNLEEKEEEVDERYFRSTQEECIRYWLDYISRSSSKCDDSFFERLIIKEDEMQKSVQSQLIGTIIDNLVSFLNGLKSIEITENQLVGVITHCQRVRTFLAYLNRKLIVPSFEVMMNYRRITRLKELFEISSVARFLVEKEGMLKSLIEQAEFTKAVEVITCCSEMIEKFPVVNQFGALEGTIFRLKNAQLRLHSELMMSLINLSNNYTEKRLENIVMALSAMDKKAHVEYDFDVEFRSAIKKKIERICMSTLMEFNPELLVDLAHEDDMFSRYQELCKKIEDNVYVSCFALIIQRLCRVLYAYYKVCVRLYRYTVGSSENQEGTHVSWNLERLAQAVWSNRGMTWEYMQEHVHVLLTSKLLSITNLDEILIVLSFGQKFMYIGDTFVDGVIDEEGKWLVMPKEDVQVALRKKSMIVSPARFIFDQDKIAESYSVDYLELCQQNNDSNVNRDSKAPKALHKRSIASPVGQISRQKLREPVFRKCREFFRSFHKESFELMKPAMLNEAWTPLSLPEGFKIIHLKELKHFLSEDFADAVIDVEKTFALFQSGEDLFNLDLHFDFGNESDSVADFPYIFKEDEELLGIISSVEGFEKASNQSIETPLLTVSSMSVIRIIGKYGRVLRSLHPVQLDAYEAFLEMFEFYLYSLFTAFGLYTYSFYGKNSSQVRFRYANLHKMVNQIRIKVKNGMFGAGVFQKEELTAEEKALNVLLPNTPASSTSPPHLVQFNASILGKLSSEEAMYGLLERCCAVQSLRYLAKVYSWFVYQLSPYLKPDLQTRLYKFGKYCSKVSEEFGIYMIRNLCTKLIFLRRVTDDIIPNFNWKLTDVPDTTSAYVDEFFKLFKQFESKLNPIITSYNLPASLVQLIWREIVIFGFECLVDGYSAAQRVSAVGRQLMISDFHQIKKELQNFVPLNPLPYVDYVLNYLNAFSLSESELISWIDSNPVSFYQNFNSNLLT
jgi:hypothetical protein